MIDYQHHLLTVTQRPDIIMSRGEGMWLWDESDNKYLDFLAGWAVNTLGHCHPKMVQTIQQQAATLINSSPAFYNNAQLNYAKRLCDKSGLDRVFLGSTGAEANESAIKLARKYGLKLKGGATTIITTQNGFHGRTLATMAATGKDGWGTKFGPAAPGFVHVPFNNIDAMKEAINDETVAIMIEPVQGEGGVNVPDPDYIPQLRQLCDETQTLLILDEVQTGFGRTGRLFGFQHYDITPDILTLAKGMGSGYPISGMMTTEALNIFEPGDQGGTYTGQPLGMAVGMTVLDVIEDENLLKNVQHQGSAIQSYAADHAEDWGLVDVRGQGLLIGWQFKDPIAPQIATIARDLGLLINACNNHTIRLIPALILNDDERELALKILTQSIQQASQ